MKYKFINANIVLKSSILKDAELVVDAGRISAVGRNLYAGDCEIIDVEGRFLAPGFIDAHTHGGGGYDFLDGTAEAFVGAAKLHSLHGTTCIVPTSASCSNETLFRFFDAYREAEKLEFDGAKLGGIHIEGGYLAPTMCGGQDLRYIYNPTPEDYSEILEKGGDLIRRWTFAPELNGVPAFMAELRKRGIQMSIGHTAALFDEAVRAYDMGATSITHFYSMTSTVTRKNALRYAGALEAGYLLDGFFVETIGDGIHLPAPLLKLIWKVKGPDRIIGITDSMRGAGMPDGPTILGSLEDGVHCIIEDGVAKLPDRSSFAGSVCTTDRIVRNYVNLVGASVPEAVQIVTLNPARILGIDSRKGSICEGKDADLVVFDSDIKVSLTMVEGRIVNRQK